MRSFRVSSKIFLLVSALFLASGIAVANADPSGSPAFAVASVDPFSPAAQAGIMPGDAILSVNGTPLSQDLQLEALVSSRQVGYNMVLSVQTGQAAPRDVTVTLGRRSVGSMAPWLGLSMTETSAAAVAASATGAYVADVAAGSPAEYAALTPGDVILSVDGVGVDPAHPLADMILTKGAGSEVTLSVQAPGQSQPSDRRIVLTRKSMQDNQAWLGIDAVEPAAPQASGTMAGAPVTAVEEGSPAGIAGIQAGDVILSVNGVNVDAQHSLSSLIGSMSYGGIVYLSVQGHGTTARDIRVDLTPTAGGRGNPDLGLSTAYSGPQSNESM